MIKMEKIIVFEDGKNTNLNSSIGEYLSRTLSKGEKDKYKHKEGILRLEKNEPYVVLDREHPNNMKLFKNILKKEVQKKIGKNIDINLITSINQDSINKLVNYNLIISDIGLLA